MRSCLAALALSVIVKQCNSLHKNYEQSGLHDSYSFSSFRNGRIPKFTGTSKHEPIPSRAVLRSEIKNKMFLLTQNASHVKNLFRMKNNPRRKESIEQTLLDAITYLNQTRETALTRMQEEPDDPINPRGCKAMCLTASIVDILALLLSTTGWMSCPMLLALLPLWWSIGVITLMTDFGMDFSEANFMLNQIITTIGYGSTPPVEGETGFQLFDALMSLTSGLLVQPTMYLLIDQSMDFFDKQIWGRINNFDNVMGKFVDMLLWLTLDTMLLGKDDLVKGFYLAVFTGTTIGYGDIDPSSPEFGEGASGLIGHHLVSPFLTQAMGRFVSALTTKLKHGPTFAVDAGAQTASRVNRNSGHFNKGACQAAGV